MSLAFPFLKRLLAVRARLVRSDDLQLCFLIQLSK